MMVNGEVFEHLGRSGVFNFSACGSSCQKFQHFANFALLTKQRSPINVSTRWADKLFGFEHEASATFAGHCRPLGGTDDKRRTPTKVGEARGSLSLQ
jgi:hypothetical protein